MERVKLSKDEKRLLRNIAAGVACWPDGMGAETLAVSASALEDAGLVMVMWKSGHLVAGADLTAKGTAYLLANPSLRNPIDWKWVAATLAASIAALFVACSLATAF